MPAMRPSSRLTPLRRGAARAVLGSPPQQATAGPDEASKQISVGFVTSVLELQETEPKRYALAAPLHFRPSPLADSSLRGAAELLTGSSVTVRLEAVPVAISRFAMHRFAAQFFAARLRSPSASKQIACPT